MKKFLYKAERAVSRIAIDNLMLVIIGAMIIVYVAEMLYPELYGLLCFDRNAILHGQVWRLLTFLFIYDGSIVYMLLSAYFYWWIGSALENTWGKSRFCLYYYIGIIATVAAGFAVGATTATFLNLSLFFAFAALFPDTEVMLFFIIPVKVKWLAIADAVLFAISFIFSGWAVRAAIIAALVNLFLFFYDDMLRRLRLFIQDMKNRRNRGGYGR